MLTFFTTARAFRGHDGIIQRNALKSWKVLDPDVEVIVFGKDEGVAEVCSELGLVYHPQVEQHASGRNRLDYMFKRASQMAGREYLCYCNCDIVLLKDFRRAFERAKAWKNQFLLVSQRWDVDITEPIDFGDAAWAERLRTFAVTQGVQRDEFWIDLFVFKRGLYLDMPPLIVGHCYWDNWMIWKALAEGVPVIDGTLFMAPVHQNHGYSAASGRIKGHATDALSMVNLETIGGKRNIRAIDAATYRMTRSGEIRPSAYRHLYPLRRVFRKWREAWTYRLWLPAWHGFLGMTRPVRSALGLRSKALRGRAGNRP
jgi:hypothetical protein